MKTLFFLVIFFASLHVLAQEFDGVDIPVAEEKEADEMKYITLGHLQTDGSVKGRFGAVESFFVSHISGIYTLEVLDYIRNSRDRDFLLIFNTWFGGPILETGREYPVGWTARVEIVNQVKPVADVGIQLNFHYFRNRLGALLRKYNINFFISTLFKSSNDLGRIEFFNRYAFPLPWKMHVRGFNHLFIFDNQPVLYFNGTDIFRPLAKDVEMFVRINYATRAQRGIVFGGFDIGLGVRYNFSIPGTSLK